MNKNDLSIVTITLARDAHEEQTLRASLQKLSGLDIPVYVTDGGSNAGFLDFLKSLRNFILVTEKSKGVWPQSRSGLIDAYKSGSKFVLYTEPDKYDFFDKGLPVLLERVSVDDYTGIITASRSAIGFNSFPAFQQMTETTINKCCMEIIGQAVDYSYGPFILNRVLIPHLEKLEDDIGWGWRPYSFGMAHRLGYRVEAFTGDFLCPPDQQEDNSAERIYRMRQLIQNIQGLVLSMEQV